MIRFTEEQLESLRCNFCNKYLSVGPVLVQPDGTSVCGRCPSLLDGYRRNFAYEVAASEAAFPCSFEGCTAEIQWGEMSDHEMSCQYRPCTCFVKQCDWAGNIKGWANHVLVHDEIIVPDLKKFNLDFTNDFEMELCCVAWNNYFAVKVRYRKGNLSFNFFCLDTTLVSTKGEIYLHYDGVSLQKTVKHNMFFDNVQFLQAKNSVTFENIPLLFTELKAECSFHHGTTCVCPCKKNSRLEIVPKSNALFRCIHNSCSHNIKLTAFNDHLWKCKYRQFYCQWPDCNFKGEYNQLLEHCIEVHKARKGMEGFWNVSADRNGSHVMTITFGEVLCISRHIVYSGKYYEIIFEIKRTSPDSLTKWNYTVQFENLKSDKYDIELNYNCSNAYFFMGILVSKYAYNKYFKTEDCLLSYHMTIKKC